jgi:hypothetical protein
VQHESCTTSVDCPSTAVRPRNSSPGFCIVQQEWVDRNAAQYKLAAYSTGRKCNTAQYMIFCRMWQHARLKHGSKTWLPDACHNSTLHHMQCSSTCGSTLYSTVRYCTRARTAALASVARCRAQQKYSTVALRCSNHAIFRITSLRLFRAQCRINNDLSEVPVTSFPFGFTRQDPPENKTARHGTAQSNTEQSRTTLHRQYSC